MRTLYLIRHGEPLAPKVHTCGYGADVPLSPAGRRQAERLRDWARTRDLGAVYTSPLLRCRQTADILAGEYTPVCPEAGLTEMGTGAWTGLTFAEIKTRWAAEYERRGRELGTVPPPGGESFAQAGERMERTMRELLGRTEGNLAVVAHGGINRGWLCRLLGRSPNHALLLPQPWGGVTEILVDAGRLTVGQLGVRPGPWPDRAEAEALWEKYGTHPQVRAHCQAVARRAMELADRAGLDADRELLRAACLLHDLLRDRPDHARACAEKMVQEGWPALGEIIAVHHDLPEGAGTEASLLYLADKLVQGDRPVSLEERFRAKRNLCGMPEALKAWERRYRRARSVMRELGLNTEEEITCQSLQG